MAARPLLSICIPTMNRSALLLLGLENVMDETADLGDEVEVIVVDNGFSGQDGPVGRKGTPPGVLPRAEQGAAPDLEPMIAVRHPSVVYGRIEGAPVVFARSFLHGPCRLAQGEYVWVIGDDDLVLRGAVRRILAFLRDHPTLDYVHLNTGWIEVGLRNRLIQARETDCPPDNRTFQLQDPETKVLERFEELVFLPSDSPFALFSGIFTFVARRSRFLEAAAMLQPTDDWDEAVVTLDNLFPHSKLVLGGFPGGPVGYIGEPCFLQGFGSQEDHDWLYKTMTLGHVLLFQWLEGTSFDRRAMGRLWRSLAYMAGRYQQPVMGGRRKQAGTDLVRQRALPVLVKYKEFVQGVLDGAREHFEIYAEAKALGGMVRRLSRAHRLRNPRVVVWGVRGRGYELLERDAWVRRHARFAVDRASHLQGRPLVNVGVPVEAPAVLAHEEVDILVLALREDQVGAALPGIVSMLKEGCLIASLLGAFKVTDAGFLPLLDLRVPLGKRRRRASAPRSSGMIQDK